MNALPLFAEPAAAAPTLRPYQQKAVDEILACIQRRRNPLFALPTAGGKSVVIGGVSRVVTAHGYETWLFAHRRELIRQLSGHVASVGIKHGIISPEHPLTDDPVQICSIDTVRSRLAALRPRMERVGLVVIDEAHHASSNSYGLAVDGCPNAVRLGVTATPWRHDGKPLGDIFDVEVRGPSPGELESAGFLAPVKMIAPPARVDISKVKKRLGDYVASQLEKVVNTEEVTQAAILAYAKFCGGLPTIAYCITVKHAEDCAEAFTAAGWSVEIIEGKMKKGDRDEVIAGLASGRHQILFSIDCVSEGVDVPIVAAGLSLRPTASTGLFLQQLGRLRRIYPGKTEAIWCDLVGNWSRHGMPNAARPWSLSDGVKGLEKAVAAVRRCARCYIVTERGPECCPNCGKRYPQAPRRPGAPSDAALAGMQGFHGLSASEISRMPFKALMDLAKTREQLEIVAMCRGYDRRWVDHVLADRGVIFYRQRRFA